jgi:hypothetical protein
MSKATGATHMAAWNTRVPELVPARGAFAPATRGSARAGLNSRRKRSWLPTGRAPGCGDVLVPARTTDLLCRRAFTAGCAADGSAGAVAAARARWAESIPTPLIEPACGRVTSPGPARTIVPTGPAGALAKGAEATGAGADEADGTADGAGAAEGTRAAGAAGPGAAGGATGAGRSRSGST